MVELVRKHGILFSKHHLKQTSIGVKAAGIQNGIVPAMERCYLSLQLLVNVLKHTQSTHQWVEFATPPNT